MALANSWQIFPRVLSMCAVFVALSGSARVGEACADLVFLHIPKSAGSTCEKLGRRFGVAWGKVAFYPGLYDLRPVPKPFFNRSSLTLFSHKSSMNAHGRRGSIDRLIMPDGNSCLFHHIPPHLFPADIYGKGADFCIIRDPAERIVSEWKWQLQSMQRWGLGSAQKQLSQGCTAAGLNSWTDEVLKKAKDGNMYMDGCHFVPQIDYFRNPHTGFTTCRHPLRYDHLQTDFDKLMKQSNCIARWETRLRENDSGRWCSSVSKSNLTSSTLRLIDSFYREDNVLMKQLEPANRAMH
eukprot:TRINITY_DN50583_c0_g1_i1.p1 TRINITY_DN50583_c0_g1~~TRINITY_DN50583_c0_g1_i1.p1  ORF type:complete len:295 (-),score=36.92 TRINITY_DN50583_c0_g1_i1:85-969(-)